MAAALPPFLKVSVDHRLELVRAGIFRDVGDCGVGGNGGVGSLAKRD